MVNFANIGTFFNRQNRWILTFIATVLIFFYVGYSAFKGTRKGASAEDEAVALWLNPKAYGYRKIIGDKNSPTLWDPKDPVEWILLTVVLSLLPITYFLLRKYTDPHPHWMTGIMAFVIWANTALLLLLLPINPFHQRFLYNFKFYLAEVLNEPAKELFIAFVFIVLLPLPGGEKTTINHRYTWLAIKIGLFYVAQNLLLGSPNYKLLPPDEEPNIFMTKQQAGYYAMIISLTIIAILVERWRQKIVKDV